MTDNEKLARVRLLLGDDPTATDEVITGYLSIASDVILDTAYPFGVPESAIFPVKYEALQCELASRYFARRGGLGEVSHNENGINRTWANADDSDILRRVTPMARVM